MRRRVARACSRLAPLGTLRHRCLEAAAAGARRLRHRVGLHPGFDLEAILRETPERKGVVVFPPHIDWGWMRQRPQQLMTQFARAGYLSLFCSPRSRVDSFRGFVRLAERLYLCEAIDPLFEIPEPIVLVERTDHWETTRRFRAPLVIYDYLDSLSVSSRGGRPGRRKLQLHHNLLRVADVVLATAGRLYDEVLPVRPDVLYCPNGVDYDDFHLPAAAAPPPPDIAAAVSAGRPIVGYTGALARWFDYGLLAQSAAARPKWEFVLIGPDFDGSLARRLPRQPNVRWLGAKRYEQLPAYVSHFAVATIPFLASEITQATSPVKLFEYMAAGRPIVTTDLPECRRYGCVYVARDAAEYLAMLDRAMMCGRSDGHRQLLDVAARQNTWEARVRQIIAGLRSVRERRRAA
jgi:hypothetical protein